MNLEKKILCAILWGVGDKIVVMFHLGECSVFAWNFRFLFRNVN